MSALDEAREKLALANRILAHEGVLDAFGHVSMRHPSDPGRYLLPRSRSPELVEPADILEFTLDSEPVVPPTVLLYGERVIHGCIYRGAARRACRLPSPCARRHAVLHLRRPARPGQPSRRDHGGDVPFWDQRDEFGDTTLIVSKPEEGRSLARALGPNWLVLMRRHGATVAGETLEQMVFRAVFSCRNAEMQREAHALGGVSPLTPTEARLACAFNLQPKPMSRAWEYWTSRVRA